MALSGKVPDLENLQDDLGNLSDPEDEAVIEEEDKQNQTINKSEDENPFVITIDKINNLLLLKPEIAEYLYLEICKEGI